MKRIVKCEIIMISWRWRNGWGKISFCNWIFSLSKYWDVDDSKVEFHLCKTHSTTFHMFGAISVKLGEFYGREQISTICRLWRNMNSLQMGQYAILVSNSRLQHAWNISESTFSPKTQLRWVWKWSSGVLNYSTIDPWRMIVVQKCHLRWCYMWMGKDGFGKGWIYLGADSVATSCVKENTEWWWQFGGF